MPGGNMFIKTAIDPTTQYKYTIRLNFVGCFCGYVAVDPSHPLHGKTCDELQGLNVHGGVTYSDSMNVNDDADPQALDTAWCIGFDTAHGCDYLVMPTTVLREKFEHMAHLPFEQRIEVMLDMQRKNWWPKGYGGIDNHKSLDFVEKQCLKLAKQLKDLDQPGSAV